MIEHAHNLVEELFSPHIKMMFAREDFGLPMQMGNRCGLRSQLKFVRLYLLFIVGT